ncbi:MAG TPA: VOC family protein [Chitinolyticbacter sp.]|nr:VOC family protein [Chitinolyticbacter sp.]
MPTFKPEHYNSVSPYLIVANAAATIHFLQQAFDGVALRQYPGEAGRIMHAEVRLDDTVIMLADAHPDWPAVLAHVHIYVPDVDATYQRALAAGATSVQEPVQKADEDKRGGVKDAGGTTWWIATRIG